MSRNSQKSYIILLSSQRMLPGRAVKGPVEVPGLCMPWCPSKHRAVPQEESRADGDSRHHTGSLEGVS